MTGYLLTIVSIIVLLCYQLEISDSQFNLYNTEENLMTDTYDHHCLYFHQNDYGLDEHRGLIPFCIRPETQNKLNDEYKICDGKKLRFKELKLINVSTVDLFKWNAVIEIIDRYEKYLLFPDLVNDNESYCNCSSLFKFGKSCEYEFNDVNPYLNDRSFTELFRVKEHQVDDETYFIGIQCQTNLPYLDWRQICNGIVDCDHGEDEPFELCLQMELNQCNNQTEFRCKTGLCIEKSLGYDGDKDCSDRSDGRNIYSNSSIMHLLQECVKYPQLQCEELNYGWKRFSCGNGQFISYSNLTLKIDTYEGETCLNQANKKYLRKLFNSNNQNQCWKSMICLTGFNYLYSDIICSYEIINIQQYCSNEFYFPSNSIVYSFVFFLYEKLNHRNWLNYTGPNYICYKKEYCQKMILIQPTILKNNLICFYVNQTLFSWNYFYEYVTHLFSSCYSNFSTSLITKHDKILFKCNLSDTFISIYRLKDKRNDCFFNEDENSNTDLCLFNTNDHFKCLTNQSECIREIFVSDDQYDCIDGSDEYMQNTGDYCIGTRCVNYIKGDNIAQIYRFDELCDNIVNHQLFSIGSNETDETDCEYWTLKCDNSPYTKCNKRWNCKNGLDEIDCPNKNYDDIIEKSFNCTNNEHYCIQLINNNTDINISCININRTGDGIIDCIGGTDERLTSICTKEYPRDLKKRFYCMNSSVCIESTQVCNRIIDCPFEDDERICPWLFQNNASKFYCKKSPLYEIDRCEGWMGDNSNCEMHEHLWFCNLEVKITKSVSTYVVKYEEYPENDENIKSISIKSVHSNKLLFSSINLWICNRGYPIQSNNKIYCLCPPSFYGNYCQYQSERLTIVIKVQPQYDINPLTIFRLIIYLLDENNIPISHDEIIYNRPSDEITDGLDKFLVYLMYKRMTNTSLYQRSASKFVRIDSYIIKEINIQYISSWLFNVSFPFLPVNRLVIELQLEDESFKIWKCKTKCGSNGKCMYFVNLQEKEYCWCNQGWFGDKCQLKSLSNLCNQTSCSSHSQCIILNDEKKQFKCICPLRKSGNQCYIRYDPCQNIDCLNNGTCLPLDQRSLTSYVCVCQDNFHEAYCQDRKKISAITIAPNVSDLSTIPVITVIFIELINAWNDVATRLMYKNISLPNILQIHGRVRFGFIRMFYNISKNVYYMIVIQDDIKTHVNTSVISENLCKNVSEIFNETILYKYSYLKRFKLYHLPCQQNKDLRCFYDEYRMCLCTKDHYTDCRLFHHKLNDCDYCKNGGLCLRENQAKNRWKFECFCPKCSFGRRCQFVSGNYFITLDMLIGIEIVKENISFNKQSFIIYFTLTILNLILLISFILNIISLIIFSNKKVRQVGCDLYLLYLTIISEIGIILLFLRFIFLIIIQIYIIENDLFIKISCIFLEYSIRLIPSIFDWLTVCISIERTYTIIKDIQFTKALALQTLRVSRWMIFIVFLLNISTTLHRSFYLILVDDDAQTLNNKKPGHPWCILDFGSTSWNIYEKFINIIHLVVPLILNLSSIILFLLRKIKSESETTIRKSESSRFVIIKEQLLKYKPLILSTMIIIVLEIPRFVSTFALACIEYPWQRYIHLIGYLISFLPLTGILFIYVIPSPKYKEQLRIIIKKTSCQSFFHNSHRK